MGYEALGDLPKAKESCQQALNLNDKKSYREAMSRIDTAAAHYRLAVAQQTGNSVGRLGQVAHAPERQSRNCQRLPTVLPPNRSAPLDGGMIRQAGLPIHLGSADAAGSRPVSAR